MYIPSAEKHESKFFPRKETGVYSIINDNLNQNHRENAKSLSGVFRTGFD
jgi:hypothetical protein